ncbi:hypothetical protein TI04_12825, partial [Achromatium sp. WMS2]
VANQDGNANYNAASWMPILTTVHKANQTITFGTAPSLTYLGSSGTLSATASSNLPVSFGTTTPAVCTVSGTTVTPVAAGTCTITADQAGNANYNAAPQVTQTITIANTIAKDDQTISFGSEPSLTYLGSSGTLNATASSGLAVTFTSNSLGICTVSGTTVTPITAGVCVVTATQSGNNSYNPAPPVQHHITVNKADQTINTGTEPDLYYNGAPVTVNATASSGLPVVFTSLTNETCLAYATTVVPIEVGTCFIVANQDGNANYNAASWMPILTTVHKANQTITFGTAPSLTYLGSSGTLSATASSNLPVSFGT